MGYFISLGYFLTCKLAVPLDLAELQWCLEIVMKDPYFINNLLIVRNIILSRFFS
jgi:hypothetical protein